MEDRYPEIKKIILNNWSTAKIKSIKEFPEGYNNIVYDIKLDVGDFVIKIIKVKNHKKNTLKQRQIRALLR